MTHPIIRIGTRGSPLALAQSGQIRDRLAHAWPDREFRLEIIKTTGDLLQQGPLKPLESTKAIFTKEIEEALLLKQVDLAIHSAKDLAASMPEGLCLGAIPERITASDILVLKPGSTGVPNLILTGSARRQRQWIDLNPLSSVEPVRGNIDTRIRKLLEHPSASGLILAEAGLQRLNPDLLGCSLQPLSPDIFIPAPGQGTLALQCRINDRETLGLLKVLQHSPTALALKAERSFLLAMNAGCSVPLGAYARFEGSILHLKAIFYPGEDEAAQRHQVSGDPVLPEKLGEKLASLFS